MKRFFNERVLKLLKTLHFLKSSLSSLKNRYSYTYACAYVRETNILVLDLSFYSRKVGNRRKEEVNQQLSFPTSVNRYLRGSEEMRKGSLAPSNTLISNTFGVVHGAVFLQRTRECLRYVDSHNYSPSALKTSCKRWPNVHNAEHHTTNGD